MIRVDIGGSPDRVRQGRARHKLFVEGSDRDVIDVEALKVLLPMVDIEAMGPSFHLKSVATALHPSHPDYYFLIDRDHHDNRTVEDSWRNFPDHSKSNLLIWRKKELENYFLDPDYLQKSQWIKPEYSKEVGRELLKRKIVDLANSRLFMEVANRVIVTIREGQKQNWIEMFTNPADFPDAIKAKERLLGKVEFKDRRERVSSSLTNEAIVGWFEKSLAEISGGVIPLRFGCGGWLDLISGKEILRQITNGCFQVTDAAGAVVQGDEKHLEVIKDLMRLEILEQPKDFRELHGLIDRRSGES